MPQAFMSHGVIREHQRAREKEGVPTAFLSHGVILKHKRTREKEGAKGQENDFSEPISKKGGFRCLILNKKE